MSFAHGWTGLDSDDDVDDVDDGECDTTNVQFQQCTVYCPTKLNVTSASICFGCGVAHTLFIND